MRLFLLCTSKSGQLQDPDWLPDLDDPLFVKASPSGEVQLRVDTTRPTSETASPPHHYQVLVTLPTVTASTSSAHENAASSSSGYARHL